MFRKAINYLLVTLITLQSVAAFADIHLYLQSDADHVSTDNHEHHDHDTSAQSAASVEVDSNHDECNHCCHCHGSASPFLSKAPSSSSFSNGNSESPDYLFSTISFQDSPDNPPPIL